MLGKINYDDYYLTGVKNGLLVISDKCPADRLERYHKIDEAAYKRDGKHIYANFAQEGENGDSTT